MYYTNKASQFRCFPGIVTFLAVLPDTTFYRRAVLLFFYPRPQDTKLAIDSLLFTFQSRECYCKVLRHDFAVSMKTVGKQTNEFKRVLAAVICDFKILDLMGITH
jgi:hypothetical protein